VTSPLTKRTLAADFAVPAAKITVAEPGTERAPRAAGSADGRVHLLAVGSIVPRKGYPVLVEALRQLMGPDEPLWHLTIVGSARDAGEQARLDAAIPAAGLGERITVTGTVSGEQLDAAYHHADVFVMPSLFEGYGMVLAEAMARGLPIICTTGGAAAETVPDGAGLKVPPGDAVALASALQRVLDYRQVRARLGDASWTAGQLLPTWDDTSRIIASVLKGQLAKGMPS
jgi:glycosyltransferase involved in cell wall biosynthesis